MTIKLNQCWGRKALFFDTETTGFPNSGPLEGQPHLVQLAWSLVQLPADRNGDVRSIASSNCMVRLPEGGEVPAGAAAVHGISAELANSEGFAPADVLGMFADAEHICDVRVAHNRKFDDRVIGIACQRLEIDDLWARPGRPGLCTQELATPVLDLPPTAKMRAAGRRGPKTPNLQEAHTMLVGHPFEGAHDAMADVMACQRVFLALLDGTTADAPTPGGTSKPAPISCKAPGCSFKSANSSRLLQGWDALACPVCGAVADHSVWLGSKGDA